MKCNKCGSENIRTFPNDDKICQACYTTLATVFQIEPEIIILKNDMTTEEAEWKVREIIYKMAAIIERLEKLKLYHGNGHHAAQNISEYAAEQFKKGVKEW